MTIEHIDIGAGELHEPKGAATANAGETYVADGFGSGTWKLEQSYGEMVIIQNSTGQALTAASDSTLYTNSDYVLLTQWAAGETDGVTYASNGLTVPVSGEYLLSAWFNQTSSINNVLVGVKFAVNGTIATAGTVPTLRRKIGTGADVGAVSGNKIINLTAGDVVTLYIACDSNATITNTDAVVVLNLLKA